MATTTTNFGWDIPQSTDLVKDGATAIAALGQDIDTALVDLKGGTTGQVLAKATNTNLDFSWVTAADGNGLKLISATACSAVSSQSVSGFSSTYDNYRIIFSGDGTADDVVFIKLRSGGSDSSTAYYGYTNRYFSSNSTQTAVYSNGTSGLEVAQSMAASTSVIDVLRPFEAKRTSIIAAGTHFKTSTSVSASVYTSGIHDVQSSYDGFTLNWFTSSFTGTIYLYGYQKA
jgi:hypothetical protein